MWNAWLLHIATVATIYHKSEYTPHISAQILVFRNYATTFNFHCYADDIQIYFTTPSTSVLPPPTLTNCIKELKLWLEANYLRFNSDKTEVILIGSKAVASKHFSQLMDLDGDLIMPSTKVRNLGVLIDFTLSFNNHFGKVVNTAFFHLRNISHIRSSLRQQDVETVIHAVVTSQLDYCNSLLCELPNVNIWHSN